MMPEEPPIDDEEKHGTAAAGPMKASEAAEFARGLSTLAEGSLPLPAGLRALADELSGGRLRGALRAIAGRMELGDSLEESIEAEGGRFPDHLRGLLTSASKSGRLPEVLGGYAVAHLAGAELRGSMLLGLAYPAMLLIGMTGLIAFVCLTVVNEFENLFLGLGVQVPTITRRLIWISHWIHSISAAMVTALGLLLASLCLLYRFGLGPVQRRRTLVALPLFGAAWRWLSLAEFTRLLGLLLEGSMPLSGALPLAGEGSSDAEIDGACREVCALVESGIPLSVSIAEIEVFPPVLSQILGWGEGQRALPEALEMAAEMFEARARAQVRFAQGLVSLLVVVLTVIGIAFLQLALVLPMVNLISSLSG